MDYFGKFVNKTARISGAAHGGQVLASEVTWSEIAKDHDLVATLSMNPLGSVSFKGIKEETPVIEVLEPL